MVEFVEIKLKDIEENKKFIARSLQGVRIWRDKWKRIRKERYNALSPFHDILDIKEDKVVDIQDENINNDVVPEQESFTMVQDTVEFSSEPVDYTKLKKAELVEYIITNNVVEMDKKELTSLKKTDLITLIEEKG